MRHDANGGRAQKACPPFLCAGRTHKMGLATRANGMFQYTEEGEAMAQSECATLAGQILMAFGGFETHFIRGLAKMRSLVQAA